MNLFRTLLIAIVVSGTPCARSVEFNLPDGFVGEMVYEVPNAEQGSWICLAVDERGRLISSSQKGALYRLTMGAENSTTKVEKIDLDIGMAMGLLVHRKSLYVMVNGNSADGPGLYRLRDTNGDDQYDSMELLRNIDPPGRPGAGHGPHAIVPSPDGNSLYIVCGNMAGLPKGGFDSSRVPANFQEDQLLPPARDPRGHANNIRAPAGWIARTDLDGKKWELICSGFRNIYDAAFNRHGDLLTHDADMEFDVGTPWYRPTRVCQVVSGGEFGWRHGSGKWPVYSPDSLAGLMDTGLGSPTGMTFGYKTNFPPPYRDALFLCDWSYGRIYACHFKRRGASYRGTYQLFANRAPLPIVDLVVNHVDGSLYLVTGGRAVQSHIYRIRSVGSKVNHPTPEISVDKSADAAHELRKNLEQLHRQMGVTAVEKAWPHLGHSDRAIRFAARIAIEHQDVKLWRDRVLAETDPQTLINAAVALARCDQSPTTADALLKALLRVDESSLTRIQRLELLRTFGLVFIRLPSPSDKIRTRCAERFEKVFPTKDSLVDRELSRLLIYFDGQSAIKKVLAELESAELLEDQIHFALVLRSAKDGWSDNLRRRYFEWFNHFRTQVGSDSVADYVGVIRNDALKSLDDDDKKVLASVLAKFDKEIEPPPKTTRPFVKKWMLEDLSPGRNVTWKTFATDNRNLERGKAMFTAASCIRCHRTRGRGGLVGPDLTGATRRFGPHDLLEAVIDPSKSIPHQFQAVSVIKTDGKILTGEVVNLNNKTISIRTDQFEPSKHTSIARTDIEEIVPSKTSLMPNGLFNTLTKSEIYDLLAWMASESEKN